MEKKKSFIWFTTFRAFLLYLRARTWRGGGGGVEKLIRGFCRGAGEEEGEEEEEDHERNTTD